MPIWAPTAPAPVASANSSAAASGAWSGTWAIQRSRDGVNWDQVPNDKNYTVIGVGYGEMAGSGDPPKLPPDPRAK